MEIEYNSSNPYNFTCAVYESDEVDGENFVSISYKPYYPSNWLFPGLIFRYLKYVRFRFMNRRDIVKNLKRKTNINTNALNDYEIKSHGIYQRIIDSAALYFNIGPGETELAHVAPISFYNSLSIVSTVSSDSRRESFETLSVQGLPSSVWVLVSFSLLVVSGLASYFVLKKDEKNRRERPMKSWMRSVWIYAADILNNCAPGVANHRPERVLRSWWLLGVTFLIQFWSAGMKSDLLIDRTSFFDTLEDLLSKPELLCLIYRPTGDPFRVTEDDPRYGDYQKMKKRYADSVRDEYSATILVNGSGVIIDQEKIVMHLYDDLLKKLKETKKKTYVGKKKYKGQYAHMLFNKGLPRAIKEEIDYF